VHRLAVRVLCIAVSLLVASAVSACSSSAQSTEPEEPVSTEPTADVLQFGPVYNVEDISDPLVAKTVEGAVTTGTPVSAEIRGYLVDWVIRSQPDEATGAVTIQEVVVMKDGSAYRISPHMRPAAGLGQQPGTRVEPEPQVEARAREAAVDAAHSVVSQAAPEFSSVTPAVYNYLVRIHLADGTAVDVWVDPDVGEDRFFYGIGLEPLDM
jgi:hypothetical protein